MPFYNFYNEKTKEYSREWLSMSKLDQFKKDNPHMKQQLSTADFIGGRSNDGGKLPEGFKDRIREMRKKHPRGRGLDNVF